MKPKRDASRARGEKTQNGRNNKKSSVEWTQVPETKDGSRSGGRSPTLGLPIDTINTDIEVITPSAQCLLSTKGY